MRQNDSQCGGWNCFAAAGGRKLSTPAVSAGVVPAGTRAADTTAALRRWISQRSYSGGGYHSGSGSNGSYSGSHSYSGESDRWLRWRKRFVQSIVRRFARRFGRGQWRAAAQPYGPNGAAAGSSA